MLTQISSHRRSNTITSLCLLCKMRLRLPSAPTSSPSPAICKMQRCSFMRKPIDHHIQASQSFLRWEDDLSVEQDLLQLQKVFRERFNYRTESWSIPSCANPSIKLTMQMASYIEYARSDHLLIVYYAGYGFVGPDHHLYWAWYDLNPHSLISFADNTLAILEKNLPDSNGKV
jgi:hypothetical protein